MSKCVSCRQKKGKRNCPALQAEICPVCCARKRRVSIPCSSDCPHLVFGIERQQEKHMAWVQQALSQDFLVRVYRQLIPVVNSLCEAILRVRQVFPYLTDQQILDALQKFIQTCQTESKGLIYEQRSSDPAVQAVISALTERSAGIRRELKSEIRHEYYSLSDILDSLHYMQADLETTGKETGDPVGFINFIAQQIQIHEEAPETPRLILP